MSNYEDVANIMLGKKSDVICDNYYNAYNVPESTLIKRRALRNYLINEPVVNNFYKNPFFQMKDKKVSYVNSLYNQYMLIENINDGTLDIYRKCNSGWTLIKQLSDKNNCSELLQIIK